MTVLSPPIIRLIFYPLLLAGVAVLVGGHSASGQTGPALSFDVGTSGSCVAIDEGDEIQVSLTISGVEELQAWEATITHDYDVIRIVEQDARVFLAQEGDGLFEASEPLPDNNGRHLLSVGGNSSVAISGSGVLATIKFEAVGEGVSTLDIPQTDLNGDGRTDEGAILTRNGGEKIDDVNGDNFFDGPVESALIAVGESCGPGTDEPTDSPTPAPNGVATATPTGDNVTPATGSDATPTPAATGDDDPTGQASGDPEPSNEGDQPTTGDGPPGEADGDGSLVPVWLVGVLLTGGLGLAAATVIVVLRGSRGKPAL